MYNDNNENELPALPGPRAGTSPGAEEAIDGNFEILPPGAPEQDGSGSPAGEDLSLDDMLAGIDRALPKKPARVLREEDAADVIRDYFYGAREYQFRTPEGRFIPLGSGDVRTRITRDLADKGYTDDEIKGAVTDAIILIQNLHSVDMVVTAAGFAAGLHESPAGNRILVPSGPPRTVPEPGEFPALREFIGGLLGEEQTVHLFGVLSVFARHMEAIREDQSKVWTRQPLPAIALAGPKGCGKTLLIALVAAMFGGRTGQPFPYFKGETRFNAELIAAEVLVVDDEMEAKDHKTRGRIAQAVKQWQFSKEVRVERKYCTPVAIPPHSLIFFAMNDGNLLCLPALDESMADKISLLKVRKVEGMFPDDPAGKDALVAALFREVPRLLHYLLEEHRLGDAHRDHRTRVAAYQHPELLEALADLSPETELMEIICEVLKDRYVMKMPDTASERLMVWKGKAFRLHQLLEASSKVPGLRLRQLLNSGGDLGTRLWHLHERYPDLVRRGSKSKGVRTYEVHLNKYDILRFLPELEEELNDVGSRSRPAGG